MTIYHILITICWAVFLIVWGVSALNAKKSVINPVRGFIVRALIAIAILLAVSEGLIHNVRAYQFTTFTSPTLGAVGVVICVLGIAFAIWARFYLGRNWGMPRAVKEDPDLVTSGPYAYVRHPIYTGVVLGMIGTGLVVGWTWLLLSLAGAIYFLYSATVEERMLLARFPDTYPAYKQRTKMLIPFVL